MNAPISATLSNIEAEQGLIGALLLENGNLNFVTDRLEPGHFSVPEHAEIYRTIRSMVRESRTASPVSLKPVLSFQELGGSQVVKYLMSICANATPAMALADHAGQIIELCLRRNLVQAVDEIKYDACQLGGPSTQKLIEIADEKIARIRAASPLEKETPEAIGDVSQACLERLQELRDGKIDAAPSTGLSDLDRRIGGYGKGRFYVVGGRPAQGKTIFGVNSMRRVARQRKSDGSNYGVMYFSLEVPYRDVWSRLIASELARSHGPLAYRDIQNGRGLSDLDAGRVAEISAALSRFPIRIIDRPALTVAQIEARARETKQRWKKNGQSLDVVFVDYLGLIRASDRYRGSRVNEVGEISSGLLAMAKNLDIAVVTLAQLSRGVEGRESKIPNMSDLRDSGAIEQDANAVVFICRPEYYAQQAGEEVTPEDRNRIIFNVDKSRDGSTGIFNAFVSVSHNSIEDRG